ncbi:MAG: hypothetical protein DME26_19255, partial [Verrucomicrobia bacterium]
MAQFRTTFSVGRCSRRRNFTRNAYGKQLLCPAMSQPSPSPGTPSTLTGLDPNRPPVPDYELLQRIGAGAYGEVWLVRSLATGVLRAVKIVHRATFTEDRPFNREFEGIKKFEEVSRSHPSQLAIFHVGRGDGYFFYVMELADDAKTAGEKVGKWESEKNIGESRSVLLPINPASYTPKTLRTLLLPPAHSPTCSPALNTRLPAARVLELSLALTEALTHLHSHGLVHRYVKPSNIIFVNGRPKLADIGLVTDASDARSIVGTEGYLAPEGPGTPQADLFALGKVLYEALTGLDRRQFPELPADLRQWSDAALAFELNAVLVKACAADVRERYATAKAMLVDLELVGAGKSVKRKRAFERTFASGRKISAAAMLLILVFAGSYFLVATMSRRTSGTQQLSPAELAGTKILEAFKKYEQGRAAGRHGNAEGFEEALNFLREAVELDPSFLQAWESLFRIYAGVTGPDARSQQRAIAKKLEQLSPNSAAVHFARGWIAYDGLEFAKADTEFQRAIQADLSRAMQHSRTMQHTHYGIFLMLCGRLQEARKQLGEAERLEPGFALTQLLLGDCFMTERDYRQARRQYENSLKLVQHSVGAYRRLGRLYEATHQIP